jgi:hypothetical protein
MKKILIAIVIFVLIGCVGVGVFLYFHNSNPYENDPVYKRLSEFNELRRKKGLPEVPENWEFSHYSPHGCQWSNPKYMSIRKRGKAFFGSVALFVMDDGSAGDDDYYYYSGKTYIDEEGDESEEAISLRYNYVEEKAGKNPWNYRWHAKDGPKDGDDPKKAFAILKSWGIPPSDLPVVKKE